MEISTLRFLPAALVRAKAIARQKDAPGLAVLDRSGRIALDAILSFVQSDRPGSAVWPTRKTLTVDAGVYSERTIYRGLSALEKCGLIERTQRRVKGGRFTSGLICLTLQAIRILQLDAPIDRPQPTAKSSRVCIEPPKTRNSLQKEPGAKPSLEARRLRLPEDLVHLTKRGVTPKGVSALMRLSKANGHRLQDVVGACGKYLDRLKPSEVYPYLRHCVTEKRDYHAMMNQAAQENHTKAATESARRWVEHLLGRFDGAQLWDTRTQQPVGIVRASDRAVEGEGGYLPINLRLGVALTEGKFAIRAA